MKTDAPRPPSALTSLEAVHGPKRYAATTVELTVPRRAEDISSAYRLFAFAFMSLFEFFYGWAWNTVDVLRPQIREQLGLTLTQAGSTYTAQGAGALLGALILGQVADRFGRRRTFFAFVIGYVVFGAAGAIVHSYPMLLAQRFALGFFLGANFPVLGSIYMGLFSSGSRGKVTAIGNGMYSLAVVALGYALGGLGNLDWHVLLWGASVPPLVLAPLIFVIVPDDRRMTAWGTDPHAPRAMAIPVVELFSPLLRSLTLRLFALVGANFFAYQAFAGWVTTYLKDDLHFTDAVVGPIVAIQGIGYTLGAFAWGFLCDRFGRRVGAIGFFGGAGAVLLYLFVLKEPGGFKLVGALWAFMIASSVAWAPWISELFPAHLRSTAMGIFNWGRLISMTAPLITGAIAGAYGLGSAMLLSAFAFALGGLVWLWLPETLVRGRKETIAP